MSNRKSRISSKMQRDKERGKGYPRSCPRFSGRNPPIVDGMSKRFLMTQCRCDSVAVSAAWIKTSLVIVFALAAMTLNGCAPSVARAFGESPGTPDTLSPADLRAGNPRMAARLRTIVASYLGTPYRNGGMNRKGMDCSGLVYVVFRELADKKFPRSTRQLKYAGHAVPRGAARAGDLIFFRGEPYYAINHVGIYLGHGRFAHASSSTGVEINSLTVDYYKRHYAGTRRVLQ